MGDQEQKSKKLRIARLADRLHRSKPNDQERPLYDVLKGILDLLADEL